MRNMIYYYYFFTESTTNVKVKPWVTIPRYLFDYFSIDVFLKLINENNGDYSKYIIMPTTLKGTGDIIKTLPANDVIYWTRQMMSCRITHPPEFAKDIYNALEAGIQAPPLILILLFYY
jgi:hypothetical protein